MTHQKAQYFAIALVVIISFVLFLWWLRKRDQKRSGVTGKSYIEQILVKSPLLWSNVALKTRVTLAAPGFEDEFDIIPDTGSNIMIVTAKGCQGCDSLKGEWDLRYGQAINDQKMETISYAGGFVSDYLVWSAETLNGKKGTGQGQGVIFGAIIKTNSPQNVMGLQPSRYQQDFKTQNSLMDSLEANVATFDFPQMQLVIESELQHIPQDHIQNTVPLVFTRSPRRIPLVEIKSMTYQNRTIRPKQRVLLDTGALWTIIPESSFNMLFPEYHNQDRITMGKGSLSITFTNASSSTIPMICPLEYVVKGSDQDNMVIGSKWLQKYLVSFDYPNKRIVFGSV